MAIAGTCKSGEGSREISLVPCLMLNVSLLIRGFHIFMAAPHILLASIGLVVLWLALVGDIIEV